MVCRSAYLRRNDHRVAKWGQGISAHTPGMEAVGSGPLSNTPARGGGGLSRGPKIGFKKKLQSEKWLLAGPPPPIHPYRPNLKASLHGKSDCKGFWSWGKKTALWLDDWLPGGGVSSAIRKAVSGVWYLAEGKCEIKNKADDGWLDG